MKRAPGIGSSCPCLLFWEHVSTPAERLLTKYSYYLKIAIPSKMTAMMASNVMLYLRICSI